MLTRELTLNRECRVGKRGVDCHRGTIIKWNNLSQVALKDGSVRIETTFVYIERNSGTNFAILKVN